MQLDQEEKQQSTSVSNSGYRLPNSNHSSPAPGKEDASDDELTDGEWTPPNTPLHSSKNLNDEIADCVVSISTEGDTSTERDTFDERDTDVKSTPPSSPIPLQLIDVSIRELNNRLIDANENMNQIKARTIEDGESARDWRQSLVRKLQIEKKQQLRKHLHPLKDSVATQLVTWEEPKNRHNANAIKEARAKFVGPWLAKLHAAIDNGHFDDPEKAVTKRVSEKDNILHREDYSAESEESLEALREKISQLEKLNRKKTKIPEDSLKEYNALRKKLGESRKQHNLRVKFEDKEPLEKCHDESLQDKLKDPLGVMFNDPLLSMIDSQVQDKKQLAYNAIRGDIESEIDRLNKRYLKRLQEYKNIHHNLPPISDIKKFANTLLSKSSVFYDEKIREQMVLFTRLSEMVSDLCGVLALQGRPSYRQTLEEIPHIQSSVVELSAFDRETAISKLYKLFSDIKCKTDLGNIFLECPADFGDEELAQEKAYVDLLMKRFSKQSIVSAPLLQFFSYYDLLNPEFDGLLNSSAIQKTLFEIHHWVLLMRDLGDINQGQEGSALFKKIQTIQQKNISIPDKRALLKKAIEQEKQATKQMKQEAWFRKFKSQCRENLFLASGNVTNKSPELCSESVKREIQGICNEDNCQQASEKYDRLKKSVEDRCCIVPSSCFQFLMFVSFVGIPYLYYSKYQEKQQDWKFVDELSVSKLVSNAVDDDPSKETQTIKAVDAFFASKRAHNADAKQSKQTRTPMHAKLMCNI